MAKQTLPTNFQDDILNSSMDGKRRYKETTNSDGSISLEDVSEYDQVGSNFGASQLNLMNDNINQSFDANKMLKTMDEVNAVTQEGYGVDALVVKELNNSLGGFEFYIDEQGKAYYKPMGADSGLPFKSGYNLSTYIKSNSCVNLNVDDYNSVKLIFSSFNNSQKITIYVDEIQYKQISSNQTITVPLTNNSTVKLVGDNGGIMTVNVDIIVS